MRSLFTVLAGVLLAAAIQVMAVVAADPFNQARGHIQAHQNAEALQLIDSGQFDVNIQTSEGFSLLHYAAGAGNLEMVRALLKRGADPNAKADDGFTPYRMAIGTMVQAELRKAMAEGARASSGGEPVQNAAPTTGERGAPAGRGMCAMVRAETVNDGRSIAERPFLKAKDAVWYNHPDEMIGLLDDCVQINATDQYGWTLLHHAAQRDRVAIARILLERGASRTMRNKDGETAANLASSAEMRALLGAAPAVARPPAPKGKGDPQMCNARHLSSSALCSDSTCKAREYRKWQTCLQTGSYY